MGSEAKIVENGGEQWTVVSGETNQLPTYSEDIGCFVFEREGGQKLLKVVTADFTSGHNDGEGWYVDLSRDEVLTLAAVLVKKAREMSE